MLLCLLTAVPDWTQQLRIKARQARQHVRIQLVVLAATFRDQFHLPRVGHDHLVPQRYQQPADPRRVRPYLERDPAPSQPPEPFTQSLLASGHFVFVYLLAIFGEHAIVADLIPQIQPNRERFHASALDPSLPFHASFTLAILLHKPVSFLHFECVSIGSLTHPAEEAGLLIPSPLVYDPGYALTAASCGTPSSLRFLRKVIMPRNSAPTFS